MDSICNPGPNFSGSNSFLTCMNVLFKDSDILFRYKVAFPVLDIKPV